MPPISDLQNTLQRQWVSKAQPQIMATAFGKTSILFPLGGPPVDIVSHCVFPTGNALMQLASPTLELAQDTFLGPRLSIFC